MPHLHNDRDHQDAQRDDIQNPDSVVHHSSGRGFASMNPERQREIASMGGHASGGNFARNPSRAVEAGRKGGKSHGSAYRALRGR